MDAKLKELQRDTNGIEKQLEDAKSRPHDLLNELDAVNLKLGDLTKEEKRAKEREAALKSHPDYLSPADKSRLEDILEGLRKDEIEHRAGLLKEVRLAI